MRLLSGSWHHIKQLTPLTVICTLVAVSYLSFRAFSMLGPSGLGSLLSHQAQAIDIGCSEAVDQEPGAASDKLPLLTKSYQEYVYSRPAQGTNLVRNASLDVASSENGLPVGFTWNVNASYMLYTYERDRATNIPYLRATTRQHIGPNQQAGAWMSAPIPMEPQATYGYSFSYRSSVPVTVGVEYTLANGRHLHESITNLAGINEWQRFAYYTRNDHGATSFRFMLYTREAGTVDTRDYDAHQIGNARLAKGIVSIAFDDGWQSVATHAAPLLRKYHVPTTQFIITQASEHSVPGYMSTDTIQALHNEGHEIGSHTLAHCDQTKLSNEDVMANAEQSKKALEQMGVGPIHSYAYPYGMYDDDTQPLVAKVYPYTRTSDVGYNDRYSDPHSLRTMVVGQSTSERTLQSWLAYAKEHKLWLVITYHRVNEEGPYNVTTAQLDSHLQRITQSGLEILPIGSAAEHLR